MAPSFSKVEARLPDFESAWYFKLPTSMTADIDELMNVRIPNNSNFEITCVLAVVNLMVPIDMAEVARRGRNLEYRPGRFASLVMKIRNPYATALVTGNGKLIVTGTNSVHSCKRAAMNFVRNLIQWGVEADMIDDSDVFIHNIAACGDFGFNIDTERMSMDSGVAKIGHYKPENFSGIIFPKINKRMSATVFPTGTMIMSGGKSEKDCEEAFNAIRYTAMDFGK